MNINHTIGLIKKAVLSFVMIISAIACNTIINPSSAIEGEMSSPPAGQEMRNNIFFNERIADSSPKPDKGSFSNVISEYNNIITGEDHTAENPETMGFKKVTVRLG